MITSVKIERLRGIKEGELNNLTPLTVLVGGNGSGKSTVLEALYIGANGSPYDAICYVLKRRIGLPNGIPWMMWKRGTTGETEISLCTDQASDNSVTTLIPKDEGLLYAKSERSPFGNPVEFSRRNFGDIPAYGATQSFFSPLVGVSSITLLEPQPDSYQPLHRLYMTARSLGAQKYANEIVEQVIPNTELIMLAEGDKPLLHIGFPDRSAPLAASGDGIHALVRLTLELVTCAGGTVLIEEPEVHQHYRTMHLTAKVIWAAIKRNIQVILTTHSLEFIDALLEARPDDADINALSIVRTNLVEGSLLTRRYSGEETLLARREIQDDLR